MKLQDNSIIGPHLGNEASSVIAVLYSPYKSKLQK